MNLCHLPTGLPSSHFTNLMDTSSLFAASACNSGLRAFRTTFAAMLE